MIKTEDLEMTLREQAKLLDEAARLGKLESAYSDYIRLVMDSPLWLKGIRIPWRSVKDASSKLGQVFQLPGLYLFGSAALIPLYIGMTNQTLWKRLNGRYVGRSESQCGLAARYEQEIIKQGRNGIPEAVRTRRSNVRLKGAVSFAQHGIDGIWLTVLPFPLEDADSIRSLERRLIPIANAWNVSQGYPELLNENDT